MNISTFLLMRFEWIITAIIVLLLVLKLSENTENRSRTFNIINILLTLNLLLGFLPMAEGALFTGFFKTTALIVFEKNVLNLGLLLISFVSAGWLKNNKNIYEFYILLLTSMLGMFTMLSSGHVLTLYIGLEMSTIPLAALANFETGSLKSSEAGIKLILSSAFSTGIMLYGISLLYGVVGDLSFAAITPALKPDMLTLLAFAFIMAGFAFKMSVVPFHLWTADVYEGSPVSVTNYLAAISKGSVIMVFISILYTLFGNLKEAWLLALSILAILTMTLGNVFALRQQNIKRLLAFSSIAQVGFVLVGIVGASSIGFTSVIYFVLIYLISNIAAFGVVGHIFDKTGDDNLQVYKGLYKSNPFLAITMAISLFSLAGIPPTAGFFGKLFLLNAGMGSGMYILLAFAAINLVLSLYNYLRIVKMMFVDDADETLGKLSAGSLFTYSLIACSTAIVAIGFIRPLFGFINHILP